MIARVKKSYIQEFVEGDVFRVVNVITEGAKGPDVFCVFAPMQSYHEDGCLYCRREGCCHLDDGEWEIIYEEGERG